MQNIIINVKGGTALGTCVDSYAVKTVTPPELVIGCEYMLRLRMFDAEGNAMAPETFDNIGAWEFVMDDDYDAKTTPKIVADNTQISVSGVTLPAGTVAEIAIPISATNTVEAAEWLGDAETKRINCELTGMAAGETKPSFVLQISGLAIRNRISSAGTPEPVGEQYYTAVQVEALVAGRTTPAQAETIAASAGSAAVVSALAAVAGSGYATSAGVLEVVSSGGYATSATVSSIVATAADSAVTSTLSAVANSGYATSAAVLPIVSAGGYTTSAVVSGMIESAVSDLPTGGGGTDGVTSAQASSIALSAVSGAGYVLSGGVLPIVSAGGYATNASVSSVVSSAVAGIDVPDDLADLTDTTDKIGTRAAAVVSSGGYTTSATVSGMISAAINEIPSGGGGTDSAAVHIYSASIGADGMVTVSGGAVTVPSLAIGDEITSGGRLWRKARQEAVVYTTSTVVSSAGGTPNSDVIIVSGAGTEIVNGTYNIVDSTAVETARIWKHESAQLWISWDSLGVAGWYLGCSYSQEPGASDAYYIQATPTGGFIDPPDAVWSSGLFEGGGASPMPTVAYGTNPAVNSNVLVVSGAGTTSVNGLYNIVDSSASGQARVWSNSENNLVVKFDNNEMFSWFIGSSGEQAGYKGKYTAPNVNVADPVGLTWQTQTGFNNGAEDPPPTVEFLALPGTSSTVVTSSVESAHIAVFNEQTEINGESGAPTVAIIADPAVEFTVLNATYGRCVQLDATTPVMSFAAPVWGVEKVRLRVITANSAVTGNVVLVPVVDGVDGDALTVGVGGTAVPVEVKFSSPVTGTLALRRDCEDSRDTLQDGEPVAVLVLNVEMVVRHE